MWLDIGDIDRAVELAIRTLKDLEQVGRLLVQDVWLIDKAVEAFLAAQMWDPAERLRLKARAAPTVGRPLLDRIEGRIAMVRGNLLVADERLSLAAQFLHDCSYRDDEWRTRRVLAEVKARRGDHANAEAELRSVIAGAAAHGHVFEGTAATRQLAELERGRSTVVRRSQ